MIAYLTQFASFCRVVFACIGYKRTACYWRSVTTDIYGCRMYSRNHRCACSHLPVVLTPHRMSSSWYAWWGCQILTLFY